MARKPAQFVAQPMTPVADAIKSAESANESVATEPEFVLSPSPATAPEKGKHRISMEPNFEARTLTISVDGFAPITVDVEQLSLDIQMAAIMQGLRTRYSGAANLPTGTPLVEKHRAILALVEHHRETGKWAMESEGGPGRKSYLAEAVAEVAGISVEDARTHLKTMTPKVIKALRADPKIKAVLARLESEPEAGAVAAAASFLAGLRARK